MPLAVSRRTFLTAASLAGAGVLADRWAVGADAPDDPVAPWRQDVKIAPVSKVAGRHTMHTYYLDAGEFTQLHVAELA